ncbi:MAG: helix-turn-helix domain-containing protein [Candidatus Limivicinus sp.]
MKDILSDIQRSIDDLQQKLNLLRSVESGSLYDVDVLMTRKEAAYFLGKSLRQIDRLCSEGRLRRCYTDRGGVRIRKSDLLEFQGLELTPMSSVKPSESKSEFEMIIQKYKVK